MPLNRNGWFRPKNVHEGLACLERNISGIATEIKMVFKINVLQWILYFAFTICRVAYLIWNDFISNSSSSKFCYDLNHHHHHDHVVLLARISLTLSRHFFLSFIASGRSSGLHPVSSHSCWMYVRAGRLAFARPFMGSIRVHHLWARPCFSSSVLHVWFL